MENKRTAWAEVEVFYLLNGLKIAIEDGNIVALNMPPDWGPNATCVVQLVTYGLALVSRGLGRCGSANRLAGAASYADQMDLRELRKNRF